MPFYALMECHFGIDGLESTHALRTSENLTELFEEQIILWDLCFAPQIFQVDSLDRDTCKMVSVPTPYPHWGMPDNPDWVSRLLLLPKEQFQAEQARLKAKREMATA